jgi:hypothetical protein
VRSENPVASAGENSGTRKKGNAPPFEADTKQRLLKIDLEFTCVVFAAIFGVCTSGKL